MSARIDLDTRHRDEAAAAAPPPTASAIIRDRTCCRAWPRRFCPRHVAGVLAAGLSARSPMPHTGSSGLASAKICVVFSPGFCFIKATKKSIQSFSLGKKVESGVQIGDQRWNTPTIFEEAGKGFGESNRAACRGRRDPLLGTLATPVDIRVQTPRAVEAEDKTHIIPRPPISAMVNNYRDCYVKGEWIV